MHRHTNLKDFIEDSYICLSYNNVLLEFPYKIVESQLFILELVKIIIIIIIILELVHLAYNSSCLSSKATN